MDRTFEGHLMASASGLAAGVVATIMQDYMAFSAGGTAITGPDGRCYHIHVEVDRSEPNNIQK